jgi:polyphosphate kinase
MDEVKAPHDSSAALAESARSTIPVPPIDGEKKANIINREVSWIAFNERVLAESENTRHPLLERLGFLAISAKNLDEFISVRVAGVKQQVRLGIKGEINNVLPASVLSVLSGRVRHNQALQQSILPGLLEELSAEGVSLVDRNKLVKSDLEFLSQYFTKEILPVIAPLTIDPAHPFPFIANHGFGLYMDLETPQSVLTQALIMMPQKISRFISLPATKKTLEEGVRFVSLEDCVLLNLDKIFPEYQLNNALTFRVLRDSELEVDEEAEDLVATFESALKARRRGHVIELQLSAQVMDEFAENLCYAMGVEKEDVALIGGMLDLADLTELCSAGGDHLRFSSFTPRFPERIRDYGGDCFAAIKAKDILVHHPYESFDVVLQFLRQAAEDPKVISIRQTLYRTLPNSPIVRALISAAEAGKSVTAMVEIKARFDEEANIRLARSLERAGVQVVYGFVDLKTHAKLSLVVRQEENGLRSYVHCGTGNYHPVTAKVYTDLSYFTSDPAICSDVVHVFNYMTSYVKPQNLNKIRFAPVNARQTLVEHIKMETKAAKAGQPSGIWIKVNALVDPKIIKLLYQASQAGVPIELVVRGICCLRAGVPGLSDNIRVISLVGRFLEHSRIYVFANGNSLPSDDATVYISSADIMPRNLNRRVEVLMPIENPTVHRQILDQVMMANLNDTVNSWLLQPDGSYVRILGHDDDSSTAFSAHDFFMTNPSLSGRGSALKKAHRKAKGQR